MTKTDTDLHLEQNAQTDFAQQVLNQQKSASDLATLATSTDGFVFITDLMKDLVFVKGFNVFPREVKGPVQGVETLRPGSNVKSWLFTERFQKPNPGAPGARE